MSTTCTVASSEFGSGGLQRRYEHIYFLLSTNLSWSCHNNHHGDELGKVKWYPRWKQWCYFPTVQAVYSASCLEDIRHFIGQLTEKLPDGKSPANTWQMAMELMSGDGEKKE